MKVLFTASTFPRWRDDEIPDFVWRQIVHIRRACPEIEAFVLAPHHPGASRCEVREGVEVQRFRYFFPESLQRLAYPAIWPNLQRAPWLILQVPFLLACQFLATLRWLRRERFSIVYSHWFMPQGMACGLAALATGTPHVFTSHSQDVAVLKKVPVIGRFIVRLIASRSRAITVVSKRSREALEGFFEDREWERIQPKVAVLPMGIELLPWQQALADSTTSVPVEQTHSCTILFVGRLVRKKGVGYLLESLSLEPLKSVDVHVVIAGTGPLLDELVARTRALGLEDRVSFAGYISGPEKVRYFQRADIMVIPSIVTDGGDAEGMPVVLLEALAAGKICVATDASNAPEILESGKDGFLVPQKDPSALARAIAAALALSDQQRREIAERARRTAARFDWEILAREHVLHLFAER